MTEELSIKKCPCGDPYCRDYHLVGIGKFVQGSGFTAEEATRIVGALQSPDTRPQYGLCKDCEAWIGSTWSGPEVKRCFRHPARENTYAEWGCFDWIALRGTKS
jgi:hypothetical protein